VDAGMNDLIRPALYQSYHQIVPVKQMKSERKRKIDIVGPVCESGDFLALGPRNARTARRRFARSHERGRVRICDGVEL
jgi:diaminopimelate decarboxylase